MALLDYAGLSHFLDKLKGVFVDKTTYEADSKKIKDAVADINDETTGINLIRGSRDFVKGTELLNEGSSYPFVDGFFAATTTNAPISYWLDDEGFTVFKLAASDMTATSLKGVNTPAVPFEDTIYTISFEFLVDVIPDNNSLLRIEETSKGSSSSISSTGLSFDSCGIPHKSLETGKWYKVSYVYNKKETLADHFSARVYVNKNGTINVRKMKIERGSINHPIWSPSPFDVDRINDETTGINLIRGTRDFTSGVTAFDVYSSLRVDGFREVSNKLLLKDKEGFAVLTLNEQNSSTNPTSSPITDISVGDSYTVSFDFMIENVETYKNSGLVTLQHYKGSSSTENFVLRLTDVENKLGKIESGKWYSYSQTVTLTKPTESNSFLWLQINRIATTGTISFRKVAIYKGRINNPIWSASPFDVVQTSDITNLKQDILNEISKDYVRKDEMIAVGAEDIVKMIEEARKNG